MDQNVSKQKNPAKPTNSPAKKVPLLWFLHHHSTPQGGQQQPYLPNSRTLICACMLAPARDGKFAKAAKVSWNPSPSCLIMLVVKGRWQIFTSRKIRVWDWFCVVEVVCEKHPSIKLIHLFGAQKKSGWSIPNSVKCDCSQPAGLPRPEVLRHSLRHEKGEQLHIPFPPLHKFIEITGL